MAIVQISKIQQRTGNLVDLPQLDEGELGFAVDEKLLYIGVSSPIENVEVLTSYSNISFNQIEGSFGNLDIDPLTAQDGQVLTYDGNNWVNRGGNSGGLINLGNVSNVKINGGGIDYVLTTDGTGNLSWTAKSTIVSFIENVSKANPGVVTTTEDNFFTEGAEITITNPMGMVELAGGVYYANILTSNTFALYSDSGLTTPVDTTGFTTYSFTSVTATTTGTNDITVGDATVFSVNDPVKFIGTTFGGIQANITYYVLTASGTTLTISETVGGSEVVLTTDSGSCNVYATGGRVISIVGGGAATQAEGSNLSVQFNNNNLLDGDPDFTFNFSIVPNKVLTLNGNINANNININSVVSTTLTGTLTTSAQPNIATIGSALSGVTVTGNLNPSANITYNLGNATNRWNDIYLANSTIYIGSGNITSNALGIHVNPAGGLINGNSSILLTANGNVNISSAGNANIFRVTGLGSNISGTLNVTGNANVGNIGATNANLTALTATGNANVGNIGATNANLTALTATGNANVGNIGATNANVTAITATGNANVGNLGTGGLIVATGNVTGGNLVTAGVLSVTGNGNLGNIGATNANVTAITATGNANVGNLGTAGLVVATGNITGGNLNTSGVLFVTGNANVGNLGTAGLITATGNITGGNLIGNHANGTSNVNIPTAGGNVNISVGGVANVLVTTTTGVNVAGTLNATGNANVGNIGATNANVTAITATGNANVGNLGTGGLIVATGNVTGGNLVTAGVLSVTGNGNLGNVGATRGVFTNIVGTLETAAQPNITSVGTLSSLTITGNVTAGNINSTSGIIGGSGTTLFGAAITTGANTTAGTITGNWTLTSGSRLQSTYADLAEYYCADSNYTIGTVLEFGGEQEVTMAGNESSKIAGVISDQPAYVMNSNIQCEYPVPVALIGRVPCKVRGKVRKGDMLVSAGDGFAKVNSITPKIGTVIGKALADFDGVEGVIEIVVGRL